MRTQQLGNNTGLETGKKNCGSVYLVENDLFSLVKFENFPLKYTNNEIVCCKLRVVRIKASFSTLTSTLIFDHREVEFLR